MSNKTVYVVLGVILVFGVGWYFINAADSGLSLFSNEEVSVQVDGMSVTTGKNGTRVAMPGDDTVDVQEARTNTIVDPKKKKNSLIIFDASGSMNGELDGQKKIDLMKKSAKMIFDSMDDDTNIGALAYGQKGSNSEADKQVSCNGIDELAKLGEDSSTLVSDVNDLSANGWTPIARSLQRAEAILSEYPQSENEILLVSDGEESCGGDPVAVAKALCAKGIRVDVLGLDVNSAQASQLSKIAESGCGAYGSIDDPGDFSVAFSGGGLRVQAPGTTVDMQNGKMNILTDGAKLNMDNGSMNILTDDAAIDMDSNSINMKTDMVDVQMKDGEMPQIDMKNFDYSTDY